MLHALHPSIDLAIAREYHSHLRRHAELSRSFRDERHRLRFRSRSSRSR